MLLRKEVIMQRFVTVLVAMLLLGVAAWANPIPVAVLSEIQVAPDSEQKLEVNANYYPWIPVDMSGWRIITRSCTATVNQGVVIPDTGVYLVLDQHNLSGTFHLCPDSDEVTILDTSGHQIEDYLSYPAPRGWECCFRPPAGLSCVPHYYFEGIPPYPQYLARLWFVASPTFGGPNPDTAGSISGTVRDQNSQPLCSASVCISGPEGSTTALTQFDGGYVLDWIGPGVFQVTATKGGQTGEYLDSVVLAENEFRSGIDIIVPYSGAAEPPKVSLKFDWRGNWLRVSTPEPALADLRTVNVAGRVCARLHEMLRAGETELHPLGALPAGVYLVQGAIGKEKVNRKVTVFK
jgi:hypothetical protein